MESTQRATLTALLALAKELTCPPSNLLLMIPHSWISLQKKQAAEAKADVRKWRKEKTAIRLLKESGMLASFGRGEELDQHPRE